MLPMKGLFAGLVQTGGQTYLPPLFPCTTNFATIPPVNVPLPGGGTVTLPIGQVTGCANEVYRFGMPVPTLPQWGLLLLALALGALAVRQVMRVTRPAR